MELLTFGRDYLNKDEDSRQKLAAHRHILLEDFDRLSSLMGACAPLAASQQLTPSPRLYHACASI